MKTTSASHSAAKLKNTINVRRSALSLLVSGLFCATMPAWADCVVSDTPNENGGVDMTCEGTGFSQDRSLLANSQNNNVTIQGDGTKLSNYVIGGNGGYVTGNTVTLNDNSHVGTAITAGSGDAGDSTVTGNTVILNGSSSAGGWVSGGDGGTVTGNTVTLNDSSSVGGGCLWRS